MRLVAKKREIVLVGVLKSKRDLRLLLCEHWYRIPTAFLPKRTFSYVAFYQPAIFGRNGKRIKYFARVIGREIRERVELLPNEPNHPRARDSYLKITFRRVLRLRKPVKNIIPRRIVFGFTTLRALKSARDILELYGVPKTEQILCKRLARSCIATIAEHTVSARGRHCRIDLVVCCRGGGIAIECDNNKAHTPKTQKQRDIRKDRFLSGLGWHILRFKEADIIERLDWCVAQVKKEIRSLCGIITS